MEADKTTPFRVSTGDGHKDHVTVVQQITELVQKLPTDQPRTKITQALTRLKAASMSLAAAPTRKIRQKRVLDLETAIKKWNKVISQYFKNPLTRPLPAINTTTQHFHGHVGTLPPDHDTFDMDGEGKQCVVCSHRTTRNNWPCCVIPQSTLKAFLQNAFGDTAQWLLTEKSCKHVQFGEFSICFEPLCCQKSLVLLCQQKHTEHCPKPRDGAVRSLCENQIPLKKLIDFLDPKDRETFTDAMLVGLYTKLVQLKHPHLFGYCTDKKCEYASKPFILIPPDTTSDDPHTTIQCAFCNKRHHVHGHKQVCPNRDCAVTFCSVCKISPYHDHAVCQGPRDDADMDEETYKTMLQTTKPCPHCRSRTQKRDACDKMTCAACRKYWCWRCVQKLDQGDPYRHTCLAEGVVGGRQDMNFHGMH